MFVRDPATEYSNRVASSRRLASLDFTCDVSHQSFFFVCFGVLALHATEEEKRTVVVGGAWPKASDLETAVPGTAGIVATVLLLLFGGRE